MPLIDRDTIIDRPVLLNRSGDGEQDEEQEQDVEVQTIGEGGGPTINGIEFEVGQYSIVAASNLAAVLATGEDDGASFKNVFRNAAIQLYELEQRGRDITPLTEFAARTNVDMLGIQPRQAEMLHGEVEVAAEAENGEVDIDEIEDQISEPEEPEASEDDEDDEGEEVVAEEEKKGTGTIQVAKRDKPEETEDDEE